MKIWLFVFLFLFISFSNQAQNAPKYSNEFLNIGVSAEALGRANAVVATTQDVTAGYWNPAGLMSIKNEYEVSLMHAEYFAGIAQFDYLSFATPIDKQSHFGVSIIRFGVDDIPDTRFLYDADGRVNYDNIRFFSAADYAFLVSYARKIPKLKNLQWGANFKIIYRNVGDFANAWGFGLDAGVQWHNEGWHLGLMARDITSTFNAWTHNTALVYQTFILTGNEIPQNSIEITLPKVILGVARDFKFGTEIDFQIAVDALVSFDGARNVLFNSEVVSIDPSLGFELGYKKIIFMRGGVNNIQTIKNFDGSTFTSWQPNFGVGVLIKNVTIDYALTDIGDQAEGLYSNIFSLKIDF